MENARPLSSEQIRQHWDDFSDEEVGWIDGEITRLIEALTRKLGISPDEAARQVDEFMRQQGHMTDH